MSEQLYLALKAEMQKEFGTNEICRIAFPLSVVSTQAVTGRKQEPVYGRVTVSVKDRFGKVLSSKTVDVADEPKATAAMEKLKVKCEKKFGYVEPKRTYQEMKTVTFDVFLTFRSRYHDLKTFDTDSSDGSYRLYITTDNRVVATKFTPYAGGPQTFKIIQE